ncbi:unnamed protein product [Blepharisma stoltei]|uniref:Uncharacterized protein n=1 Tax=Blepharisma stoltei TaxID=1481888 RepID=A0AAU9JP33_9CILI|nr:unnamed protein product [Blepharisma stoltei]
MVENSWNFQFLPPQVDVYSKDEVFSNLIHSAKAYSSCAPVVKKFAECRKRPIGKIVDPETCQPYAEHLIECYNEVKGVPASCKTSYEKVFNCLQHGGKCEEDLRGYLDCKHPATSKYEKY